VRDRLNLIIQLNKLIIIELKLVHSIIYSFTHAVHRAATHVQSLQTKSGVAKVINRIQIAALSVTSPVLYTVLCTLSFN
jgi:hypothetical protein